MEVFVVRKFSEKLFHVLHVLTGSFKIKIRFLFPEDLGTSLNSDCSNNDEGTSIEVKFSFREIK